MKKHAIEVLLVKKKLKFHKNSSYFFYDQTEGFWKVKEGPDWIPATESTKANKFASGSKKNDVETGEDQKGQ